MAYTKAGTKHQQQQLRLNNSCHWC